MQFENGFHVISRTQARLLVRHEPARGTARGTIVVNHGLAEHSRRYRRFAEFLALRGFHVYAHDHRGHGETSAPDSEPGRFAQANGANKVVDDSLFVAETAANGHPGLPLILFGHSMGGMIAAAVAEQNPSRFAGLAVWNSNLNPGLAGRIGGLLIKAERFFKGSDVPSALGPKLTFDAWGKAIAGHRTMFDWLSHDQEEVARYVADPLCGFDASVSMWLDVLALAGSAGQDRALARLPEDLPVNLVGGGEDPATDKGRAMHWLAGRMKARGMRRVELTVYPGMRHETLNEIGREEAMKAFAAWADGVIARLG